MLKAAPGRTSTKGSVSFVRRVSVTKHQCTRSGQGAANVAPLHYHHVTPIIVRSGEDKGKRMLPTVDWD